MPHVIVTGELAKRFKKGKTIEVTGPEYDFLVPNGYGTPVAPDEDRAPED